MLTPPKLVVNRRPGAKFLSNTNPQCAGFGAGGDVTGKSQAGEFPRPEKRKIASLTPDLVLDFGFMGHAEPGFFDAAVSSLCVF